MSRSRPARRTGHGARTALGFALAALLVTAGCEDLIDVEPDDQRIAVGAAALDVCPDETTGVGTVDVIASVFGVDGSLVSGVSVSFSPDRGSVTPTDVVSDARGEALATLSAPATGSFDPVVVTAIHPEGLTDAVTIRWPSTPQPCAQITASTPGTGPFPFCFLNGLGLTLEVDDPLDIVFSAFNACNIARASITIDYDPAFLSFVEARRGGTLEIDDMGGQTRPTSLSAMDDPVAGIVTVEISQDPPSPPGTNLSSSPFVVLTFSADAETPVIDEVPQATLLDIVDYSFTDNFGIPYPQVDPLPPGSSVVIVPPAGP